MAEDLILNRYRPLEEAGTGGYGTVTVAWDPRIQRRVAIKEMAIDPDLIPAPADGQTTYDVSDIPGLEESRTAALLSDPTIVGVLDFEVQGSVAYLIMEYVDGCTLTQLLHDYPEEMTPEIVGAVFAGVASALKAAHGNQVLHLDIKPDNVLVNRSGEVKVTDFGLARLSHAGGFDKAAGGTIGYMPPEQMNLEALDERCDEWALASIVYEMISGSNPFMAEDLKAAKRVITQAELVLPHLCMEGIDSQVDDVLFYALDPDREGRYATVAEFAEELAPLLGNPKTGKRQLARLVNEATDDAVDADVPPVGATTPLDRTRPRTLRWLLRLWAAANCGLLGAVALSCLPSWGGDAHTLPFWGLLGAIVAAALILPQIGSLLAVVALALAFLLQGAYAPGALVLVAGILWWAVSGRRLFEASDAPLSAVPLGVVGLGAVTPVLCGYFLRPRDALASTIFAALLALLLAGPGADAIVSWSPGAWWNGSLLAGSAALDLDALRTTLTTPGPWIDAVSWVVAALVLSLSCTRGSRPVAFMGAMVAGVVLVLAAFARTWAASAGLVVMPPAADFLRAIVPLAVGGVACIYGVPPRG